MMQIRLGFQWVFLVKVAEYAATPNILPRNHGGRPSCQDRQWKSDIDPCRDVR